MDNLVLHLCILYFSASELWHYKRGWPYKRGDLWLEWPYKRGDLWLEWPYKRGDLWLEWPNKCRTSVLTLFCSENYLLILSEFYTQKIRYFVVDHHFLKLWISCFLDNLK